MLKMTTGQKRMIFCFGVAIAIAVIHTSTKLSDVFHLHDLHTLIYACVVIAWGFLVHQRITNRLIRKHLVAASFFMWILFFARMIRCFCADDNVIAKEYAWYFYYVSFTAIPTCCFMAALCVGKTEKDRPLRHAKWLWLFQALITLVVFTNPWHEMFFRVLDRMHDEYEYGPLFYVCIPCGFLFAILTLYIIVRRCQIESLRKYGFIPALGMMFFFGLLAWYYLSGGSPEISGHRLYLIQEVYCLTFIFPFESMIQLGIMPNNSRYALFFENSPINVNILDEKGNVVYASSLRQLQNGTGQENEARDPAIQEEARRRSERKIYGGKVVWYEDLTPIQKLNSEIQKVTEKLEEENDLIREENRIRSERISYETKNRLYDKIAGAVKEKALAIDEILTFVAETDADNPEMESDSVRKQLIRAMILGAYVKRKGNIMLITEEADRISTKELSSAIRESLDYFQLTGIPYDFQEYGEICVPSKVILLAQELWQILLETALESNSLLVILDAREGFHFRTMLETEELSLGEAWRAKELAGAGVMLKAERMDDVWRLDLGMEKKSGWEKEGKA